MVIQWLIGNYNNHLKRSPIIMGWPYPTYWVLTMAHMMVFINIDPSMAIIFIFLNGFQCLEIPFLWMFIPPNSYGIYTLKILIHGRCEKKGQKCGPWFCLLILWFKPQWYVNVGLVRQVVYVKVWSYYPLVI